MIDVQQLASSMRRKGLEPEDAEKLAIALSVVLEEGVPTVGGEDTRGSWMRPRGYEPTAGLGVQRTVSAAPDKMLLFVFTMLGMFMGVSTMTIVMRLLA